MWSEAMIMTVMVKKISLCIKNWRQRRERTFGSRISERKKKDSRSSKSNGKAEVLVHQWDLWLDVKAEVQALSQWLLNSKRDFKVKAKGNYVNRLIPFKCMKRGCYGEVHIWCISLQSFMMVLITLKYIA